MNGVSRAVLVATVVLMPALSSAQQTSKSGFDYNYAELSYDKHDFDVSRAPDNIDGDGFTLSGSFKVADDWHVYASYGTANLDLGLDVDTWVLGLGYNYSLKPNVDLYGRVLYIDQSASSGQFSAHDNGLGLQFRVRGRVNEKVEVEGGLQYVDVASSDTSLQASVRYYFTRQISAGVGITLGGNADGLGVNVRYSF
ncbi:MAG TPA: porin [Gammaproteobacteria bacterium]|nr:porin [Gammaproteobacteria bacterium]